MFVQWIFLLIDLYLYINNANDWLYHAIILLQLAAI